MRTPFEYITDIKEDVFKEPFPLQASAYYDQFHAEVKRVARNVGVDADSKGFKASFLLAADVLDHFVECLQYNKEDEGAQYIEGAAYRLRLLALWGEQCKAEISLENR